MSRLKEWYQIYYTWEEKEQKMIKSTATQTFLALFQT